MGILRFISNPINLVYFVIAILVAITVHEFLHAWTANYLGDSTPKLAGRVSLNPLVHLDPLGTLALLLIGIGWGKPVPINPNNFKNPRLGSALTGLAGPLANLLLAMALAVIYRFTTLPTFAGNLILATIYFNIVLMIFNLVPIPPLDGSHLLALIFPQIEDPKLQQYGPIVLVAFLILGGFAIISPIIILIINMLGININQLAFLFA